MKFLKTVKSKIAFLNVAILAILVIGYSLLVLGLLTHMSLRGIDRTLDVKVQEMSSLINSFVRPQGRVVMNIQNIAGRVIMRRGLVSYQEAIDDTLAQRILETLDRYELRDDYAVLFNVAGQIIAASENTPPEVLEQFTEFQKKNVTGNSYSNITYGRKLMRMHARTVTLRDQNEYVMMVATSLSRLQRTQKRFLVICIFVIPATLVLGGFIGAWIASRILKPVMAVADTASKITQEDLSQRVNEDGSEDELKYLIHSFNGMIERLEKSFAYISQFSAHAAHELKTPLAVMRGESEIALRKERTPEEYREALHANLRESQRMIRVVEDMLYLSRLDYDPKYLDANPIDVASLIRDIGEKAKILAEIKNIAVFIDLPQDCGKVSGDENAIRRLLLNLIDNAIKFTPDNGRIELVTEKRNKMLCILVKDNGRGISAIDMPKVFEKFYHRDEGALTPGNGLGLSIAMAIAKAHQGNIEVMSQPGHGASFTVSLPLLS